jgi:hypothetical protein
MFVASVLSKCYICYNSYVVSICSKCFICFRCMLQLFHLSVAKVDLGVGWSSEGEKASTRAMAASAGKLAIALHRRKCRVTSALAYAAPGVSPHHATPNQWPACLCHCQVHGLLRAQHSAGQGSASGVGAGALSRQTPCPERDGAWARELCPNGCRVLTSRR